MTAPSCKRPLTDDIVDAFAAYYLLHPYSWGTFHVCLEDGNWEVGAVDPTTDEELALAAISRTRQRTLAPLWKVP